MGRTSGAAAGGGGGVTAHADLTGLSADDHTQYYNELRGDARYLRIASNLADVIAASARTNLGVVIGTDVQAYDADLSGVAAVTTTGLIVRTGAGTAATRSIATGSTGIVVANGDGVSGNPTLSLDQDLVDLAAIGWARGDIPYRGASAMLALAKGTSGQVLRIGANDPYWADGPRVFGYDVGATVASTTTNVTILASAPSTPGTLTVGDVIHVHANGTATNSTGTNTYNFAFSVLWGAVTVFSWQTPNLTSNANPRPWAIDLWITVEGIGVTLGSGAITVAGFFQMGSATSSAYKLSDPTAISHTAVQGLSTTVTTNSAQTLDIKVAPSFSSAALSATSFSMVAMHIPKI